MSYETLVYLAAAVALVGLMAYAVLGGADFGGGVWDLLARGPRRDAQRDAITHAMGPVWEANHVWLIFVIVVLFTCFPYAFAPLAEALFIPFHLALLGIMLRGVSFVFRSYGKRATPDGTDRRGRLVRPLTSFRVWTHVFGIASVITPFILGAAFGAVTSGAIRVDGERSVTLTTPHPWLSPYAIGCGFLALSTCAYLAAVYLTAETTGPLRDDFRRRAIVGGTATAALAGIVLVLAWFEASWFFGRLLRIEAAPVLAAGLLLFGLSAWAVFTRRYRLSRIFAAGEVILLLLGWGLAHQPFLIYPDVTPTASAAPAATIRFLLLSLPVGAAVLVPSLWLLFKVFKQPPVAA